MNVCIYNIAQERRNIKVIELTRGSTRYFMKSDKSKQK